MASPTHGHEFGWTPGVGDGQGGLACCGPQGHKESDTTEPLTELNKHMWFNLHVSPYIELLLPHGDFFFQ